MQSRANILGIDFSIIKGGGPCWDCRKGTPPSVSTLIVRSKSVLVKFCLPYDVTPRCNDLLGERKA